MERWESGKRWKVGCLLEEISNKHGLMFLIVLLLQLLDIEHIEYFQNIIIQ